MKPALYLVLLLALTGPLRAADVWTRANGETLEGTFVRYDKAQQTVQIKPQGGGSIVTIKEDELSHKDRLKVILQAAPLKPYWYTDYEKAKAENPTGRCLFIYPNGFPAELFELEYHRLLLSRNLKRALDGRDFVVCIGTDNSLPDELDRGPIIVYKDGKPAHSTGPFKQNSEGMPLLIFANFKNAPEIRVMHHERMASRKLPPISRESTNPFVEPKETEKAGKTGKNEKDLYEFKNEKLIIKTIRSWSNN